MWLLIPASDSCFWHQSLHMCLSLQVIGGYMIHWCYSSAFSMVIWTQCEFIKLPRHETHYFIIEFINKSSISHYSDVIMVSQVTSTTIVYSTVYSGTDHRKHQSSMSLAFVRGINWFGEFPTQRASNVENVSIWWCHHEELFHVYMYIKKISTNHQLLHKTQFWSNRNLVNAPDHLRPNDSLM